MNVFLNFLTMHRMLSAPHYFLSPFHASFSIHHFLYFLCAASAPSKAFAIDRLSMLETSGFKA